jgi:CRISPR/Cas system-associated exonuclease Cas4 (RecB family)
MNVVAGRRWSISAVRDYLSCPRMWWLKRAANVEQEASSDSYRGQLMHAGLAAGYREVYQAQREHGGWLDGTVARRGETACELGILKEAHRLALDDYDDELVDTACRALRHLGPRRGDHVIGIEHDMDIQVDGVPIGYRADLIYRRGGVLTVRDWKSAKELPKARDLHRNWQLALGALCVARTLGDTSVRVEIASIGSAVVVSASMPMDVARDGGRVVAEAAQLAELELQRPVPFAPEPGSACAGCPVRRHCPVYAEPGTVIPTPHRDGSPASTAVIEVGA